MSDILVSICCIAYNHEKYIRDCIEGFLIQKTNFPIEILIYDDASEDKTQEIIKEYSAKHPNIIIYLQKENQWSKGKYGLIDWLFPAAKGKYIALCEGDDYWTDPYKLQKQVDFLEANPEYGLVHSDYDVLNDATQIQIKNYNKCRNKTIPSNNFYEELLLDNFICTATVCCRKILVNEVLHKIGSNIYRWKQGDRPLWMGISLLSKIGYIDESTAVRRILEESAQHTKNIRKKLEFVQSSYDIRFYFIENYGCSETTKRIVYLNYYKSMLFYAYHLKDGNLAEEALSMLKIEKYPLDYRNMLQYWGAKFYIIWLILKLLSKLKHYLNLIGKH